MRKTSKRAEAVMKKVDMQWQPRQILFLRVPAQASGLECCSVLLLPSAAPSQHPLARQAHSLICRSSAMIFTHKPSLSSHGILSQPCHTLAQLLSSTALVTSLSCLCVVCTASPDPTVVFRCRSICNKMLYSAKFVCNEKTCSMHRFRRLSKLLVLLCIHAACILL